MNAEQLLRDPNVEPTNEIIAAGLSAANNAYVKFLAELPLNSIEVDWRYYKDGNAWLGKALHKWTTTRGTQKEITAFWLSIWDGFFKVSFFIPEKARGDALKLPLDDRVHAIIEEAKQIGKMKIFPMVFDLRSEELFEDIFTLVKFKISIK